ncbi:MAG: PIN domain-containing protein [Planctomycetaceae bacterium]|nr:PIN domain-containing protein [Planctomycetaceae bacterium]
MNVFLDTNILLDFLGRREPFADDAQKIWSLAERGDIRAHVSAISFSNVFYLVRKWEGLSVARKALVGMRGLFTAVACDSQIIDQAIDADFEDFEDAIQFVSAVRSRSAYLVTRNPGHFRKADIAVVSPSEFLAAI